MRTLGDGSYLRMLEPQNLNVDLGSDGRESVRVVGVHLLWVPPPPPSLVVSKNM